MINKNFMTLDFITTNKNKLKVANQELSEFDIELVSKPLNITEIQSNTISEIAIHKARMVFKITKKPSIITDAGWNIPSLNGFPGPYMRDIGDWFSPEDFLHLMKPKSDKRAILEYIAIYKDERVEKVFTSIATGKVLDKAKGQSKYSNESVITFRPDKLSIAECIQQGKTAYIYDTDSLWKQVGKWLTNNRKDDS